MIVELQQMLLKQYIVLNLLCRSFKSIVKVTIYLILNTVG